MKALFDHVSLRCSRMITRTYSTSFSLGIRLLAKPFRDPIYSLYGFVRLADEIVDSFHEYPKERLLNQFRQQTDEALADGISLNPVLNSFQSVVHRYAIDRELIDTFLDSMEMDLQQQFYTRSLYEKYILGSAEVVGLMCLRVFTDGDNQAYESLRYPAMKLGSAFQKVNFLRDVRADSQELGRVYFPHVNLERFSAEDKAAIEAEIEADFREALTGIRKLPPGARKGVFLAYSYYRILFDKIRRLPPQRIMTERIRVPNAQKFGLMLRTMVSTA
jgi:phytoene synthase